MPVLRCSLKCRQSPRTCPPVGQVRLSPSWNSSNDPARQHVCAPRNVVAISLGTRWYRSFSRTMTVSASPSRSTPNASDSDRGFISPRPTLLHSGKEKLSFAGFPALRKCPGDLRRRFDNRCTAAAACLKRSVEISPIAEPPAILSATAASSVERSATGGASLVDRVCDRDSRVVPGRLVPHG